MTAKSPKIPFLLQGMAEEQERWISANPPQARDCASGHFLCTCRHLLGPLSTQKQKEALTQISNPFADPSPRKGSQTSPVLPKAPVHQAGCHSPGAAEEVGTQGWRTSSRIQVTSISQGEAPGHKSFSPQEVQKLRALCKWSSYKKDPRDLWLGGGWCLARGGDDYSLVAGAGGGDHRELAKG